MLFLSLRKFTACYNYGIQMSDYLKFFDRFSFFLLLSFPIIGVFLIYSASYTTPNRHALKQTIWLVIALFIFFTVIWIKPTTLFKSAAFIYVTILFVLLIQLIFGHLTAGVKSWIKAGFFNIQVSELIKIPLALLLAKYLSKTEQFSWGNLFQLLMILSPAFALIALQPDLGTAFLLLSFVIMSVLLKGIRLSVFFTISACLIITIILSWSFLLKPYQKDRLISFVNPEKYSQTSGYQVIQSQIAIGAGELTGQGYLKGSQAQMKFLPARHTDFILSVLGEEFGFIGISILLFLYFLFFYRQLNIKVNNDEDFYFIYLFSGFILFQFIINVLMSIGLFPIMGVPLPFISYGGSSLITFFIAEAIVFRMKLDYFSS